MTFRNWKHTLALALVALLATPTFAQKGGKGGGGGGGTTDPPPPKPNVSYQVDYLPIDGLLAVNDVNDLGVCVIQVRVQNVPQAINTVESRAAAIVDTSGQVRYLDNIISSTETWDIINARDINNTGQIAGVAIKNGVRLARPVLLTPKADATGYDLVDLGIDGSSGRSVVSLNEHGDVLLNDADLGYIIRYSGGESFILGESGRYYRILTSDLTLGGSVNNGLLADTYFKTDTPGNEYPFQFYSSNAYNHTNVKFANSGYSVGIEQVPEVKKKGASYRADYFVTHDPFGSVRKLQLPDTIPVGWFANLNGQVINGEPLVVGNTGDPIFGNSALWIRFPGFTPCYIRDLMGTGEQARLDALSSYDYTQHVLTPRNANGTVNHLGAPTIVGAAYYFDTDYQGYEGIFVISPIAP